jgi:DNA-binding CsgD family transcriptional regulator
MSPETEPFLRLFTAMALAVTALGRGEVRQLPELYDHINSFPGIMAPDFYVSTDRVLGLLADAVGDRAEASRHFEDAISFCRKAEYLPELAWTCHDYAAMLLDQDLDDGKAQDMVAMGQHMASSLGMPPLLEKLNALQERVRAKASGPHSRYANLTERQTEVLLLIAQGKTNREIARQLVLSDRTVQRHVSDIYDRIGARNRAEATAFALNKLPASSK